LFLLLLINLISFIFRITFATDILVKILVNL